MQAASRERPDGLGWMVSHVCRPGEEREARVEDEMKRDRDSAVHSRRPSAGANSVSERVNRRPLGVFQLQAYSRCAIIAQQMRGSGGNGGLASGGAGRPLSLTLRASPL